MHFPNAVACSLKVFVAAMIGEHIVKSTDAVVLVMGM
jgi:hypothetical protein